MIAILEDRCENKFEISLDDELLGKVNFGKHKVNDKICGIFDKENIVPDVWRYDLEYKCNEFRLTTGEKVLDDSDFPDRPPCQIARKNVIVVLLESPHKKEYIFCDGTITPKGPAQGRGPGDAGGGIERYLPLILSKTTISPGEYSIIISNPVPYHVSLGHFIKGALNTKLRDHVWLKIWDIVNIQNCFMQRLKAYEPTLILNCCTVNLTSHINNILYTNGLAEKVFIASHPAVNWNITKANTEVMSFHEWEYVQTRK